MSNLQMRVISALIMASLVALSIWAGRIPSLISVYVLGVITLDEIQSNFYIQSRRSKTYLFSLMIFSIIFFLTNFAFFLPQAYLIFIYGGLGLNLLLVIYLFFINLSKNDFDKYSVEFSWALGALVAIPMMSLSYIIQSSRWQRYLVCLLLVTFMVDTAAYFCGKYFGKHKLWEKVSPKKTVEGALGGVLMSMLITSAFWSYFLAPMKLSYLLIFVILASCAQIGDLAQSKLKRQFEIKDSSSLIPGHGGVYDRIDSLLFVTPLFAYFILCIN